MPQRGPPLTSGAEFDLEEKKKKADELQVRVNAQKISSSDVHKMNADRNKLQSNTKAAADRHQELFDQSGNLEIKVQNVSDGIEKLITVYKTKAFALELMPRGPPPFEHVDFSQALNGGASDLADMVPDPQAEVRPALTRLKKSTMDRRRETGDQVLAMEEKLTTLGEAMVERKDLLAAAEGQVDHVTAQLNEVKEVGLVSHHLIFLAIADVVCRRAGRVDRGRSAVATGGQPAAAEPGHQVLDDRRPPRDRTTPRSPPSRVRPSPPAPPASLTVLLGRHDELVQQVEKLKKENVDEFASMLEFFVEYKSQCADKVAALQQHAEAATA